MRRLFFHLLKRYTYKEKDRLDILKELFNGVQRDYYEQTLPGNIHNFTIETLLANEWIRQAVHTNDKGTMQIIKNTITSAVEEAYTHIREGESDTYQESKIGWYRIETKRGKNRSKSL